MNLSAFISLFTNLSIHSFIHPSTKPFNPLIHPSVPLFIHPSHHPTIHRSSICVCVYLFLPPSLVFSLHFFLSTLFSLSHSVVLFILSLHLSFSFYTFSLTFSFFALSLSLTLSLSISLLPSPPPL